MNGFGMWLRQLSAKLTASLRNFMAGRYGTDRLNMVILCSGLVASLLSVWVKVVPFNLIFWALSYGLMIWAIFRSLSRKTYKRYQENRKFLQVIDRLKDRDHRYFDCPKCRQMVRVPRGKGKISITCPRCREKFVKKT
jgi:ribosomal protein L37AE/L43A